LLFALALTCVLAAAPLDAGACVVPGQWAAPARPGTALPAADVLAAMARRPVVLLGELHDRAEHHRWQLHTIAALHGRRPGMALAFEMFPRRVQAALDRWVAGELGEAEFLAAADWTTVWNFDPAIYMPLFHFARMHRIPMIAANVERSLIRAVAEKGYDAVPAAQREGVGRPAPAPDAYVQMLLDVFREHPTGDAPAARDDARFRRFVAGQTMWDRAMAEAIAEAVKRDPERLVVAVMGRGHTYPGAVPHQLRELGVAGTAVLWPHDRESDCSTLARSGAEAVFGLAAPKTAAPSPRPRLGVGLAVVAGGVRIEAVEGGSIAAAAGLRTGDVLVEMAGGAVKAIAEVRAVIERQAPGTWLPLRVRRGDVETEVVARFPP